MPEGPRALVGQLINQRAAWMPQPCGPLIVNDGPEIISLGPLSSVNNVLRCWPNLSTSFTPTYIPHESLYHSRGYLYSLQSHFTHLTFYFYISLHCFVPPLWVRMRISRRNVLIMERLALVMYQFLLCIGVVVVRGCVFFPCIKSSIWESRHPPPHPPLVGGNARAVFCSHSVIGLNEAWGKL